ncbi:hypothetical protein [Pseudorhodoferax sp.]|uniref:hypothetical protein n=1 Tax=Pseudorhodoferax sp. TaxID=1993553 RepID=UPI002DD62E6D|nr:hypothetical protein [Pseudorhodoferax sp.]
MNTRHVTLAALAALALSWGSPAALAGPTTEAAAQCLTDNTTGKDRKDLAKWIFVGMAAHPEIRSLSAITPEATEEAQKAMGRIVTQLIGTACAQEMAAAVKADGPTGINAAFEHLGKIAMQELMSNPQVNATIGGFERFIDKKKLEPVLRQP